MKKLLISLLLVLMLAFPIAIFGATATWNPVTTNTDGTACPVGTCLAGYYLYVAGVQSVLIPYTDCTASLCTYPIPAVPACGASIYVIAYGVDGLPSSDSNTVVYSYTIVLTYSAGANGKITGTSPQTINCGTNGTAVTAVPNSGYVFSTWSDGSTANPRTDKNVTANISVTASFVTSTPETPMAPAGLLIK